LRLDAQALRSSVHKQAENVDVPYLLTLATTTLTSALEREAARGQSPTSEADAAGSKRMAAALERASRSAQARKRASTRVYGDDSPPRANQTFYHGALSALHRQNPPPHRPHRGRSPPAPQSSTRARR
jgi:hypothetical protein